jgi:hypothetical protein
MDGIKALGDEREDGDRKIGKGRNRLASLCQWRMMTRRPRSDRKGLEGKREGGL